MKNIILNEKNIGLPPGTPVYVGDKAASAVDISVLTYNKACAQIHKVSAVNELPHGSDDTITWIDVNGLRDIESIKKIGEIFDIHALTIEDVLNTRQQPKIETFQNYRFILLKSINYSHEFTIEQISIIRMKNVVITFHEIAEDPFAGIKKRIMENIGHIRAMEPEYLTYSLIDAVADEYYLALAFLEEKIENFEDQAVKTSNETFIAQIQEVKKHLFQIRRAMAPLRDNLVALSHQELTSDGIQPFLRDLQENLNNAIETVEHYREWLSNIIDVNLSVLSYQMNKVMRTLAIITAIFIPLSFIAGVYGMNFEHMPELGQPLAYPIVLCGMAAIASSMVIFFKIRKWF